MSREDDRHLSTADLAGAAHPQHGQALRDHAAREQQPLQGDLPRSDGATERGMRHDAEPLADLFLAHDAEDFRRRWDAVQIGFVDDPRQAVRSADELVAQVMKTLAESFAQQRAQIEAGVDRSDQANTENLRVALQRYRSFFQRLLSL